MLDTEFCIVQLIDTVCTTYITSIKGERAKQGGMP